MRELRLLEQVHRQVVDVVGGRVGVYAAKRGDGAQHVAAHLCIQLGRIAVRLRLRDIAALHAALLVLGPDDDAALRQPRGESAARGRPVDRPGRAAAVARLRSIHDQVGGQVGGGLPEESRTPVLQLRAIPAAVVEVLHRLGLVPKLPETRNAERSDSGRFSIALAMFSPREPASR